MSFYIILAIAGGFAGLTAGLFGIGGGIVLVPAFLYVFVNQGYEHSQITQIAVATSLATIVFTSLRSVLAHNRKGVVDWQILRLWAPAVVIGAVLAVFVATWISARALLFVFAILALIVSAILGFGLEGRRIDDKMPTGLRRWGWGGGIGFFSTLMGIGGGSLAVPMQVLHGTPIHRAVATGAGFGGLIALPAAITFALSSPDPHNLPPMMAGFVNLPAFLLVIIMTMITAPLGATLAHRLDAGRLRKLFAFFIFIVALNMLRKALF